MASGQLEAAHVTSLWESAPLARIIVSQPWQCVCTVLSKMGWWRPVL